MPDPRVFLEDCFAAAGGEMSFEDFMGLALYSPDHGYYTTGITGVGGRGADFATAATLSGGLARAVAGWILEEARHHRWRGPVPVIEVGGGDGSLGAAVRRALGWFGRRRFRFHWVEVSPVLRSLQQQRIGRAGSWHESIAGALAATEGRALIFSNELVDAFPVTWLVRAAEPEGWREVRLRYEPASSLQEVFRDPPGGLDPRDFSALSLKSPSPGQRIEVLPAYRRWLTTRLDPHWRSGSLLTIDYGGESAEAVYHRRPGGSLRAFFRHERLEGAAVYRRFGRQDLTSDVNFADLLAWGSAMGWENHFCQPQSDFLARHGAGADPMSDPGSGGAFWVLGQRKRE